MRRAAVIVGCSTTFGQTPLPGVESDFRLHIEHLRSIEGGAWEKGEVSLIRNPQRATDVYAAIAVAGAAEFAYVAFSGHGAQPQNAGVDGAHLYLSDGNPILLSSLYTRAPRSLIIVDACRDLIPDPSFPLMEKHAVNEGLLGLDEIESRRKARRMYDDLVMAKGAGPVVVTSCAPGQNAGDTTRGGSFTWSLMYAPQSLRKSGKALSIAAAVEFSGQHMARVMSRPQQTPEYHNGRSTTHFPFAVWPA